MVIQDVENHRRDFDKLEDAIKSVIDIADECCDQQTLSDLLTRVTERFNALGFQARSYVAQKWLEDKETQLDGMTQAIFSLHVSSLYMKV